MDLFNLLIFLDTPVQSVVRLVYNDRAKATIAYKGISAAKSQHIRGADATTTIEAEDSYGRQLTIDVAHVAAVQLANLAQELNGEADLGVQQQHAQMNFQKRLQTDPMLNKPGIVPVGGNGMPLQFPPRN